MIKDITITGVKYELNATTKKYVEILKQYVIMKISYTLGDFSRKA